jgi:hypothetical protein
MSKQTTDELIAACAAAKAKGHAEDAERSAARVREAIATFERVRAGHRTYYVARGAAVTVRTRTTRAANHAARNVRAAEFQAEKQKAVAVASDFADDAAYMTYEICQKASRDTWRAHKAYLRDPQRG